MTLEQVAGKSDKTIKDMERRRQEDRYCVYRIEKATEMYKDELQVNADMTFDLIGNLETLDYKIADSKEIIASYER